MPRLDLRNFKGLAPRLHSRLKEATYADAVTDAKLWDGTIRNFPCPTIHCEIGQSIQSITPIPDCPCLTWPTKVDIVIDCDLVYFTGDGKPQIATFSDLCQGKSCGWCVPCPKSAPKAVFTVCDNDKARYVAYTYTRLKKVGNRIFESALSPPTQLISVCSDSEVKLSGLSSEGDCTAGFRIYRAESGLKFGELETPVNDAWLFVGETTATEFTNKLKFDQCEPADPMLHEAGCPPDNLHSLRMTESGVMVGLSGDELWYTYPGDPMSWGKHRRRKIRSVWGKPLRLEVHKDDVYVLTDKFPINYRVQLQDSGVQLQRNLINKYLPLVSIQSVSSGYQGVVYASDTGLILLHGGEAQSITSPWFNRDQWRRLKPETLAGVVHDDAYIMSTEVDAFLFEFGDGVYANNENSDLIGLNLGGHIIGASSMYAADAVYWSKEGVVYRWDWEEMEAGNHKDSENLEKPCCPFFYRPSIEDVNSSATYTAAEVHLRPGSNVVFRYYDTDCRTPILIDEELRTDCDPFRLTDCRRTEDSMIEVEGCGTIDSITLGTSYQSLRSR